MKYRVYYFSYSFLIFSSYGQSKVYEIKEGRSAFWQGFKYSLLTFFFGFWGFWHWRLFTKEKNTPFKALAINFQGGEDVTKIIEEFDFTPKANYLFKNITRNTAEMVDKKDIEFIIELQEDFEENGGKEFSEDNIQFLLDCFTKVNFTRWKREEILDFFDAMNKYKDSIRE